MSQPTIDKLYVTIPLETAQTIDGAFLPSNPNRMRRPHPEVLEAAKDFKVALLRPHKALTLAGLKAADEMRTKILALQAQCCGGGEPCPRCRALLEIADV